MPSSNPVTIPHVMSIVNKLQPLTILDVGCGNGRYGFLFREMADLNYGRFKPSSWIVTIDAVEVESDYISPIHRHVYNTVFEEDWLTHAPMNYDLIFMGDVLEHFCEGDWQQALQKARSHAKVVIVVAPNGESKQGAWRGYEHEQHLSTLNPMKVGGICMYKDDKTFISLFQKEGECNQQ